MWDEPLRFQAHLPIYFWGECVLAAVHLINRTPSPLLQNKTPYEMLFGTPPSYNVIRTFGCLCFAQNQHTKGDKFASKSRKCIFVGYPFGKKGWYLFDLDSQKFFVSRVKFFEDVFPFLDPTSCNIIPKNVVPKNAEITLDLDDIYEHDFPLTTQFTPTSSQTQAASHLLKSMMTVRPLLPLFLMISVLPAQLKKSHLGPTHPHALMNHLQRSVSPLGLRVLLGLMSPKQISPFHLLLLARVIVKNGLRCYTRILLLIPL